MNPLLYCVLAVLGAAAYTQFGIWVGYRLGYRSARFDAGREAMDAAAKPFNYLMGERNSEPYIRCLNCGKVSFNPHDIDNLYCGHCMRFHLDKDSFAFPRRR